MEKLFDKLILFIFCTVVCFLFVANIYVIIPILIAIFFSALLSYFDGKKYKIIVYFIFLVICIFMPSLITYMPLIIYDIMFDYSYYYLLFFLIPILYNHSVADNLSIIAISIFSITSFLLKRRTLTIARLKIEYINFRDENKEFENKMKAKNKELMEKQDYEINIATLNERNRIARDIHDSVGHLLSSSILQIGALIITTKDEQTKNNLITINNTLNSGMNSIRDSIHNIYDHSIDLKLEITKLVNDFSFCDVNLKFDCNSYLNNIIKYTIIAIVKEALTNISKHSNATDASIIFREFPSLYQLIIEDNGNKKIEISEDGIGLKNIANRVSKLDGTLNIFNEKGFKLFIVIPKKEEV